MQSISWSITKSHLRIHGILNKHSYSVSLQIRCHQALHGKAINFHVVWESEVVHCKLPFPSQTSVCNASRPPDQESTKQLEFKPLYFILCFIKHTRIPGHVRLFGITYKNFLNLTLKRPKIKFYSGGNGGWLQKRLDLSARFVHWIRVFGKYAYCQWLSWILHMSDPWGVFEFVPIARNTAVSSTIQ